VSWWVRLRSVHQVSVCSSLHFYRLVEPRSSRR
jgi:hypothetical protein